MIYFIVFVVLLMFVLRYDINGRTSYRNECYYVMLVFFILIAGLRYRLGIDTTRYLVHFYYETPELQELTWSDLEFGKDPLFIIMNSIVLSLGGKFYVVQLLQAAFVNILIFQYIRKHTNAIFICIFFYFIWQYTSINMEEMRASMSMAVCLFANDYMLEKKWFKGLFLYCIGCLFHTSAILVIVMSLFFFLRFNKLGFSVLVGALVLGFVIQPYIKDYLLLMEFNDEVNQKAQYYVDNDKFMETNRNFFGYLGTFITYVYGIISLWFVKTERIAKSSLKKLEPLMMVFLIFAFLSIGLMIAYRFYRFYVLYYIIFITELMVYLLRREPKLSKGIVIARTLIILFPFFIMIAKERMVEQNWVRYHPYSSIFDLGLDNKREKQFSDYAGERPIPGKY